MSRTGREGTQVPVNQSAREGTQVLVSRTGREGTEVPVNQSAREGTPSTRESNRQGRDRSTHLSLSQGRDSITRKENHVDEQESQEHEEDLLTILEEECNYWCEVERAYELMKEARE